MKVFVYGTLRKHEKYHHLLEKGKCEAEQAWVYGELFDTGLGYPVMKESSTSKVYGELYEIDEEVLRELDRLEDFQPGKTNNLYNRIETKVYTDTNTYSAFAYIENQSGLAKEPIKDGDWKLYTHIQQSTNTLYFAYGSCMDVERFEKASVDHYFQKVIGACTLDRYSMKYLFSVHDGGRADIIEDGGITEGILYDIPKEGLDYLFEREGFYTGWYRPTFVDVKIDEEIFTDVLTFHVYNKKEEQAPPLHYATEILRGSKGRVSSNYYEKLKSELRRLGCNFEI